mgnify:FL=1|jgi:hypothetical protein
MTEYIDRQELLRALVQVEEDEAPSNYTAGWIDGYAAALDVILCIRAADVNAVVTCQNCKWDKPDVLLDKHWCTRLLGSMEVRADDYCSYGRKK